MKILCTMKSIKQQIYYFSYALYSTQSVHKNYHMHVLHNFFLPIKNNKNNQSKALELHITIFLQNLHDIHFSRK
jgi:hypothetical protein